MIKDWKYYPYVIKENVSNLKSVHKYFNLFNLFYYFNKMYI